MEASFHFLSLFKPRPQDQYFCFRNTSFREITKQSSISINFRTVCNDKSPTPDISNFKIHDYRTPFYFKCAPRQIKYDITKSANSLPRLRLGQGRFARFIVDIYRINLWKLLWFPIDISQVSKTLNNVNTNYRVIFESNMFFGLKNGVS